MIRSLDSVQPCYSSTTEKSSCQVESDEKEPKGLREAGPGVPLLGAMGPSISWPLGIASATLGGAAIWGVFAYHLTDHTRPTPEKILNTSFGAAAGGAYTYFLALGLRVAVQKIGWKGVLSISPLVETAGAWASGTTVGAAGVGAIGITVAVGAAIGVGIGTGINYLPKAFGAEKTVGDHIGDWMTEEFGPADRNGKFFKTCEFLGLA